MDFRGPGGPGAPKVLKVHFGALWDLKQLILAYIHKAWSTLDFKSAKVLQSALLAILTILDASAGQK